MPKNYPKLGHMKGHFCLHILLAGVNNETDAHAFQFLIKYCEEKGKLKIEKFFDSFASINLTTCLNFKKLILTYLNV